MTNRGMAANVRLFVLGGALCLCAQGFAQSSSEGSFDDFVKSLHADFDDFRNKCNEEYAAFLKNRLSFTKMMAPRLPNRLPCRTMK